MGRDPSPVSQRVGIEGKMKHLRGPRDRRAASIETPRTQRVVTAQCLILPSAATKTQVQGS